MRPPKDIDLNRLSRQAEDITDFPPDEPLDAAIRHNESWRKLVYWNAILGKFMVKMLLGDAGQIVVGVFRHEDVAKAVRFADCAKLYFWRYKKTKRKILTDADFNTSLETAKRDLEGSKFTKSILVLIENHLLEEGQLPTVPNSPIVSDSLGVVKSAKGIRVRLLRFCESELKSYAAAFPAERIAIATYIDDLKHAVKVLNEFEGRLLGKESENKAFTVTIPNHDELMLPRRFNPHEHRPEEIIHSQENVKAVLDAQTPEGKYDPNHGLDVKSGEAYRFDWDKMPKASDEEIEKAYASLGIIRKPQSTSDTANIPNNTPTPTNT